MRPRRKSCLPGALPELQDLEDSDSDESYTTKSTTRPRSCRLRADKEEDAAQSFGKHRDLNSVQRYSRCSAYSASASEPDHWEEALESLDDDDGQSGECCTHWVHSFVLVSDDSACKQRTATLAKHPERQGLPPHQPRGRSPFKSPAAATPTVCSTRRLHLLPRPPALYPGKSETGLTSSNSANARDSVNNTLLAASTPPRATFEPVFSRLSPAARLT